MGRAFQPGGELLQGYKEVGRKSNFRDSLGHQTNGQEPYLIKGHTGIERVLIHSCQPVTIKNSMKKWDFW